MKLKGLLVLMLVFATLVFGQTVIGYTSFEEPATGSIYTDSDTTNHALTNHSGEATVIYTSTGGELGFSAYYTNTLIGSSYDGGLSDGDYIGVTDYTPATGSMADGLQAYQLSDTDGLVTVSLDPITLTGTTTVYFSAQYFIAETGWETTNTEDYIRIWLTVDGTTNIDILNTKGSDIDVLNIEGAWTEASQTITASSSIVFHFELQANSASEAIWLDKIYFSTGGAVPNTPTANAGSDQTVLTGALVTLDGSGSKDIDDNIANYHWTQLNGAVQTLSNADSVITTFTAPITPYDFTFELLVTDSTGLTDRDTVTIYVREPVSSYLLISEYIEGSSNNKALELYNYDTVAISMDGYMIKLSKDGGGWTTDRVLELSGILEAGEVYVIGNSSAVASILDVSDTAVTSPTYFNGNDAVGLFLNGVLVDVIGNPNNDPGYNLGWEVAGTANATKDHTLIRKPNVETGNTDWAASAGTDADNSEWIVMDADYFADLGSHTSGPVAYTFSNSVVTTPFPQAGSEISITIDITPEEGGSAPTTVKVYYGTGDTQPNHADMWLESGTTYAGIIPSLLEGNIVLDYYIEAIGGTDTVNSALYSMIVAGTVITISDIHDNIVSYDGLTKTIEGVITIGAGVLRDDRTSCYIQDASGRGLNLYDASEVLTDLTRGTRVKLVGEVDLYFTTVEIKDFSYSVVSTGQSLPAAQAVSVAGANSDDLEGTLATVTGTLSEIIAYSGSKNLILTEGTDSTIVKVWETTGINTDTLVIGTEYAITGVGSKYSTEHQLLVGYVSDITDEVAICDDCYIPASFSLSAAYPNPFNPNTTLEYSIDQGGVYELSVYNITGQRVSVLASGYAEPGIYKQTWNAGSFTSGIYFIRLEATDKIATRKVVLIK